MNDKQEVPPVFRSWPMWYAAVLGFLLLQMVLYYLVTSHFA